MQFNSIHFLIFFPIVVALYFSLPQRLRWILLLIASYYFYMCWKAEYVLLIIASTLIDYFAALKMGQYSTQQQKRPFLILSLVTNLGLLFAFKYFNFFNDSFRILSEQWNIMYSIPTLKVLLPVGISFYTFQTLSYSIEVYRGNQKPEQHLGVFAVYVAFFPQLVAGPIERSMNLLPQFKIKHQFDYEKVRSGLLLMLWGFFKKLVIADRMAILVNQVYNHPQEYSGIPLWIATFCFAFQIYCDFSAYSDIAIGSARVMGIDLMKNFNFPYCAKSIGEFWKRWHISLSTWFRDYLYIPLGGNKTITSRWTLNILIVFIVSGLWHGANWTFIIWGFLHGLYFLINHFYQPIHQQITALLKKIHLEKLYSLILIFVTFCAVCFAWIFFRANSLNDAAYIITHLFQNIQWKFSGYRMGLGPTETLIGFFFIAAMEAIHFIQRRVSLGVLLLQQDILIRWLLYLGMIFIILIFGKFEADIEFIYFQF